jgi:hypothetical protein
MMQQIKAIRYSYYLAGYHGRDKEWSVFLNLEGHEFQELQCATEKEAFELGESFCNALHAANVRFGHDERPDFVVMSGSLTDASVPTRTMSTDEFRLWLGE